jgi:hypothetical protein
LPQRKKQKDDDDDGNDSDKRTQTLTTAKGHATIKRQIELQGPQHMDGVPVIELRNRPMFAELI